MFDNKTFDKKKSRNRYILVGILFVTVVMVSLTLLLLGGSLLASGNTVIGLFFLILGILVLITGGIYGRMYNHKTLEGEAILDEMSTFQLYKAGYYSFVASMYIMAFMLFLLPVITPVRFVIYIGLIMNFVAFIVIHSIVKRQDLS